MTFPGCSNCLIREKTAVAWNTVQSAKPDLWSLIVFSANAVNCTKFYFFIIIFADILLHCESGSTFCYIKKTEQPRLVSECWVIGLLNAHLSCKSMLSWSQNGLVWEAVIMQYASVFLWPSLASYTTTLLLHTFWNVVLQDTMANLLKKQHYGHTATPPQML